MKKIKTPFPKRKPFGKITKPIVDEVWRLRKEYNYNQAKLAKMCDISRTSVHLILSGKWAEVDRRIYNGKDKELKGVKSEDISGCCSFEQIISKAKNVRDFMLQKTAKENRDVN